MILADLIGLAAFVVLGLFGAWMILQASDPRARKVDRRLLAVARFGMAARKAMREMTFAFAGLQSAALKAAEAMQRLDAARRRAGLVDDSQ